MVLQYNVSFSMCVTYKS